MARQCAHVQSRIRWRSIQMNFVNQEVELQPMVDAIYSARVSKELRVRQILNLFRSYSEYEVLQAISYLIFRYQAHLKHLVQSGKDGRMRPEESPFLSVLSRGLA